MPAKKKTTATAAETHSTNEAAREKRAAKAADKKVAASEKASLKEAEAALRKAASAALRKGSTDGGKALAALRTLKGK